MNTKKYLSLCAAMLFLLAVLGCGAPAKGENTAASQPAETTAQTDKANETSKVLTAAPAGYPLQFAVQDATAPRVLFTRDVSAVGLLRIYERLGQQVQGKTAIKISFETPGGPHLDPQLLKPLRDKVSGTFVDCNGFSAPRNTTEGHLRTARGNGFTTDIGPIDILDAEGELDLPVQGKHLKFHRTGSHFANYDTFISVVRFKVHHLRDYGGTLKNLSICLASTSGKANIHSGGRELQGFFEPDMEAFLSSMGEAVKAAEDAKPGRWVFINVLAGMNQRDTCEGAQALPDMGIVASLDPVAADQAAVDFTFGSAKTAALRKAWEAKHQTRALRYAEEAGAGKRHYRLESIDS